MLYNVTNNSGSLDAIDNDGIAISETVYQNVGDNDFESARDPRSHWLLEPISFNSDLSGPADTPDTFTTDTRIEEGDRLFIVKDDQSIVEWIVPASAIGGDKKESISPTSEAEANAVLTTTPTLTNPQNCLNNIDYSSAGNVNDSDDFEMIYEFPTPTKVDYINFHSKGSNRWYYYPEIRGSNDGINYINLISNMDYSFASATVDLHILNPRPFKYYKFLRRAYYDNNEGFPFTAKIYSFMLFSQIRAINTSSITAGEVPTRVFKFNDEIRLNGKALSEFSISKEYGTQGNKLLVSQVYNDLSLAGREVTTKVEFQSKNELTEFTTQLFAEV